MAYSTSPTLPGRLVSQLIQEDESMRDLVVEFLDELPGRFAELRDAHRKLDWELLRLFAHRLKGAGGSYGYPQISETAAALERAAREHRDEEFDDWMRRFEELLSAARAGLD